MQMDKLIELITEKEIEYRLAKKKTLQSKLKLKQIEKRLTDFEKLKSLILIIAKQAKKEIKEYLENIVTNALQIVYGEEYSFEIHIEKKKDQEEIYFYLKVENGPLLELRRDLTSGGSLDMISLGLRIGILSLLNAEPILFLDEPLKNLGKFSYIGAEFIKELSHSMGIQIFLITHDDELIEIADKVYKI